MLLYFTKIASEIIAQCAYPDTTDYVVTNYFRDKCGPCDRVTHFLDEIDSRLERNSKGLTFRYVDCGVCDCPADKIEKVPTVTISKNKKELSRFMGFREFGEIVELISEQTGIDRHIFKKRIKSTPGKVVQLKDRDFLTAFDGPWLILFYATKSDLKRELIEQIAEENEAHLNVGEISGKSVPDLLKRFSIPSLPALLAFHGGLLVGFNGKETIESLRDFVTELTRPSLPSIDQIQFKEEVKLLKRGEPIFVVFYKDLSAANDYFQSIAHEYKFRARLFKSDDAALAKEAGVDLEKKDLVLTVYRNGVFHENPNDLSNRDHIFNWIFHAHYPFLTQVTNETIYMVMHGIKPVVLLLSRENDFVQEFEDLAEEAHKGQPFIDKVYASIDIAEYSLFMPRMLPDLVAPTVVMLDPATNKFYADNKKITKENIKDFVEDLIQRYDSKKVQEFPRKKGFSKLPIILVVIAVAAFALAKLTVRPKLKIVH